MQRAFLASCVVFAACSDEAQPPPVESSANSSIAAAHQILDAAASSDRSAAAAAVLALATAGDVLIARETAPPIDVPDRVPRPTHAALTGSVMCEGATCIYDYYGDDTLTVNGSLTVLPDRVIFDLDFDVADPDLSTLWLLEGDLTVTPTLIDGWVDNVGFTFRPDEIERTDANRERWWGIYSRFVGIVLDDSYCAIAGAFEADILLGLEGQDVPLVYGVRVAFGPGCGDVR